MTDDLGTQGARPSAVMTLLVTFWDNSRFHREAFSVALDDNKQ